MKQTTSRLARRQLPVALSLISLLLVLGSASAAYTTVHVDYTDVLVSSPSISSIPTLFVTITPSASASLSSGISTFYVTPSASASLSSGIPTFFVTVSASASLSSGVPTFFVTPSDSASVSSGVPTFFVTPSDSASVSSGVPTFFVTPSDSASLSSGVPTFFVTPSDSASVSSGVPTFYVTPSASVSLSSGVPTFYVTPSASVPLSSGVPTFYVTPSASVPLSSGVPTFYVTPSVSVPLSSTVFVTFSVSTTVYVNFPTSTTVYIDLPRSTTVYIDLPRSSTAYIVFPTPPPSTTAYVVFPTSSTAYVTFTSPGPEPTSSPFESSSIPFESSSIPFESSSIPFESSSIPFESSSVPLESPSSTAYIVFPTPPPSSTVYVTFPTPPPSSTAYIVFPTPPPSSTVYVTFPTPPPSSTAYIVFPTPPPSSTVYVTFPTPPPSSTAYIVFPTPPPSSTVYVTFPTPPPSSTAYIVFPTPPPSSTVYVTFPTPPPSSTAYVVFPTSATAFVTFTPVTPAASSTDFVLSSSIDETSDFITSFVEPSSEFVVSSSTQFVQSSSGFFPDASSTQFVISSSEATSFFVSSSLSEFTTFIVTSQEASTELIVSSSLTDATTVFTVPSSLSDATTVFTVPSSLSDATTVFTVPSSLSDATTVFTVPSSLSDATTVFTVPSSLSDATTVFTVPSSLTDATTVFTVPSSLTDATTIISVPSSLTVPSSLLTISPSASTSDITTVSSATVPTVSISGASTSVEPTGSGIDNNLLANFVPQSFASFDRMDIANSTTDFNTISFDFRTDSLSGLLIYQPGLVIDFLSIELIDGAVVFKWNPGSQIGTLTSVGASFGDGEWHNVFVGVRQREAFLQVDGGAVLTSTVMGPLHRVDTVGDFYVGGLAAGVEPLPNSIKYTTFAGCIRNLYVPQLSNPLDFAVDVTASAQVTFTCQVGTIVPAYLASFAGEQYASFGQFNILRNVWNNASLSFRTTSSNGLLLYQPGIQIDFVSIELVSGLIVAKWDVGSGTAALWYNETAALNDGLWHTVEISIQFRELRLRVDGGDVLSATAKGPLFNVDTLGNFYVGGLPSTFVVRPKTILSRSFTGCIQEVVIPPIDYMLNFKQSINLLDESQFSCSADPPARYTFGLHSPGESFVQFRQLALFTGAYNNVSFSFRTVHADGLLMYQPGLVVDFVSVELLSGAVVLKWNAGNGVQSLTSGSGLNNNAWHDLMFGFNFPDVFLTVNDGEKVTATITGSLTVVDTLGDFYMGGLAPEFSASAESAIVTTFDGCLGNIRLPFTVDFVDVSHAVRSNGLGECQSGFVMEAPADAPVFVAAMQQQQQQQDEQPSVESRATAPFASRIMSLATAFASNVAFVAATLVVSVLAVVIFVLSKRKLSHQDAILPLQKNSDAEQSEQQELPLATSLLCEEVQYEDSSILI